MFQELSDDILGKIFCFLEARDVIHCSLVCKSWYRVARGDQIWHKLCENYFVPSTLKSLMDKLEENAFAVSKGYCSEPHFQGSRDSGFIQTNVGTQEYESEESESSDSSATAEYTAALPGTKVCCCEARKRLARLIQEFLNGTSYARSQYSLFIEFYRYFSRGSYYVSRMAKVLDKLETLCRERNLAAARTLLPGVDSNCIEEQTGKELTADIDCLYRLCGGQYVPAEYSQFQGILGGYLFYDVLVDWNLSSVSQSRIFNLRGRRIYKV